ncbi:MAG: ATP-binding cassette domain-containing protein, partial [Imperialibacter sp.]
MLKATGIKKKYGNLEVLKGIDLEIAKGEVVSIVGASGAGKSTLLHILGSLDNPDEGTIELSGKDVFKLSSTQLASFRNKEIGFVF